MARIGIIIVVGAMVISMAAAMYAYTLYQTNYIEGKRRRQGYSRPCRILGDV